jgi:hypothetical protein
MEPMLHLTPAPTLHMVYKETHLNSLLDALDELHEAASEGDVNAVTTMSKADLMGLLRDIIYTAQETMVEIETHGETKGTIPANLPQLSLVRKHS